MRAKIGTEKILLKMLYKIKAELEENHASISDVLQNLKRRVSSNEEQLKTYEEELDVVNEQIAKYESIGEG